MKYKRNMTDDELFPFLNWKEFTFIPEGDIMPIPITLEELLYRYRTASMCIVERHHSEIAKDVFRAQLKKLHQVILEKYGEERI